MNPLVTNLHTIQQNSLDKQAENDAFSTFLKNQNSNIIDAFVFELNQQITPQINCLQCGNCCKSLLINVTEVEANTVANHLQITRETFNATYVEKGTNLMVINTVPCHFLQENTCTIYPHRFAGCKEFPAMHIPNFTKRLFTTFMHYGRCPIIYNIVEQLKEKLNWNTAN